MRGALAIARALGLVALMAPTACFDSPARAPIAAMSFPSEPASEDTACARLCGALEHCRAAEPACASTCANDRARAREGLLPSSVGCLEHEIATKGCGDSPDHAKSTARACWLASVTALKDSDEERPFLSIATASCRRFMRCTRSETSSLDECVKVQRENAKGRGVHAILAATRTSVIESAARCVETQPCSDEDPLATCFSKAPSTSPAGASSR
ncbi:MAG: hypothetical protein ACHREM_21530 [Polyangiales bacterium]